MTGTHTTHVGYAHRQKRNWIFCLADDGSHRKGERNDGLTAQCHFFITHMNRIENIGSFCFTDDGSYLTRVLNVPINRTSVPIKKRILFVIIQMIRELNFLPMKRLSLVSLSHLRREHCIFLIGVLFGKKIYTKRMVLIV